ncbi:hypothetical protein IQ230_13825 [Gloeocapsopsis crepidinum LEGE 06123]|uniref:Uncharacterized protein n=1 Tax=Gloeocapsopsis crepidinum LEGE 06123 TaxID=588587 RepID=A0ABR9UTN0_9CHRO|nr:hypothetical protein [Gloeocapsopsis crepidinum]MBE9191405.1 hypothetical protein [Gloeocapsopsis crepidinum LEGE 06123]
MWDFTNTLNWDPVLRRTYNAQPATADGDQFIPIPPITTVVDSSIIMIGAKNSLAKPSWYLAGSVSSQLLITPSSTTEFVSVVENSRKRIGLNRLNLFRFNNYNTSQVLIEINLARWHKQMYLEVWKYSGSIGDLEAGLARIESKIDTLNSG